jgi:hypothetical protein
MNVDEALKDRNKRHKIDHEGKARMLQWIEEPGIPAPPQRRLLVEGS